MCAESIKLTVRVLPHGILVGHNSPFPDKSEGVVFWASAAESQQILNHPYQNSRYNLFKGLNFYVTNIFAEILAC